MTKNEFIKKQEVKINRLWSYVKKLKLSQDEIEESNIKGFLYSVGRINDLQITIFMVKICLRHHVKEERIYDLLGDKE